MISYEVVCYVKKNDTPFVYMGYKTFDDALIMYNKKCKDLKKCRIDIMKVNYVDGTYFQDYREVIKSNLVEQISLFDAV